MLARCVLFAEVPNFYAAVARADDPSLAARPVIVGGDPRKRGRVQSATADALALGVSLEMSVLEALRLCPGARAVRTDMTRYREVSRRLFAVLREVEPHLETFGMAACYADASAAAVDIEAHARHLIDAVARSLGLPLKVGIGAGKFLARVAAEEVPGERGSVRVPPGGEAVFLAPLPAARIDGVGRKTAAALAEMGGHTIADVVRLGRERLQTVFGPHGLRIFACATGTDADPVRAARHPKSLSRESTLPGEPLDVAVFGEQLAGLAQQLEDELGRMGLAASRVAVKVRYADQGTTTRSATLPRPTAAAADLWEAARRLLDRTQAGARPARGLGIQLSRLVPAGESDRQLDLFSPG
jgi:DNA polymerase-4